MCSSIPGVVEGGQDGSGEMGWLIDRTSMLNDDDMAAYGFLGIFMTRKLLDSLSEVSLYSTKPTKMIAEQKNSFWKD